MGIWSLTTDTDSGIFTSLHLSESEAYLTLARNWFPPTIRGKAIYSNPEHDAMIAALNVSPAEARKWLDVYLETTNTSARVIFQSHRLST